MTASGDFSRAGNAARPCWTDLSIVVAAATPTLRKVILCTASLLLCLAGALSARAAVAADVVAVEPVELFTGDDLSALVAPVALYPDDLLAVVLPAATFPLQVVLAARFLEARDADPTLEPDERWDDSIVALLNYPEVVALLDGDLMWTWQLGEAVLVQQEDVIVAVSEFREQASAAGNLTSDDKQVVSVSEAGAIEITPAEREIIYVPYYDPQDVTVYQPTRVYHYYPRTYPVYYYPYPSGHYFSGGAFWGVTSAFSIGWHTRSLHWHHHGFRDHPYFGFTYYEPFYYRRPHFWLSYYDRDRLRRHDRRHHDDNRWRDDNRRGGSRSGYRPYRPGLIARPGEPDRRSPDDRGRMEPPSGPAARGIERSLIAMPDKQSSHIPASVNAGAGEPLVKQDKSAGKPGTGGRRLAALPSQRSSKPIARPEGQTAGRTTSHGAVAAATAQASPKRPIPAGRGPGVTSLPGAILQAPRNAQQRPTADGPTTRLPTRLLRQQPARPAASVGAPRVFSPIRKPAASVRAPRVSSPIRKPAASVRAPRVSSPIRKPAASVRAPRVSSPIRKPAASVRAPRVSSPIRKPAASVTGPRMTSSVRKPPASVTASRMTRPTRKPGPTHRTATVSRQPAQAPARHDVQPARVSEPAKKTSPKLQQRQRRTDPRN